MKFITKRLAAMAAACVMAFTLFFSVNAKAATSSTLNFGSRGEQVSNLQQDLKAMGYFTYWRTTGYYGEITRSSVIKFQNANGLSADGIAGEKTLYKIDQVVNSGTASYYTVKAGDSLWKISQRYGTSVDKLKAVNNIIYDTIYPGQTLKIVTPISKSAPSYSSTDMYWLSRIIEAEASGEPYQGKVAVGSVILNRVAMADFPNSVKGVIFEYSNGLPQFSPVADGTIYNTPSQESINAAVDAFNGAKPAGSSTFFFNPSKSAGSWIVSHKTYVTRIGNHVFYK